MTKFKGTLQRGFIGNITYQYNMKNETDFLKIRLDTYPDNREENQEEFKEEVKEIYSQYAGDNFDESQLEMLYKNPKTEIQLAVFLNGEFIGNQHNPLDSKEMIFSEDSERSRGCMKINPPFKGHLKIIVNSYHVIDKELDYILSVSEENESV